ncbi:MAG: FeoB-associated Cys-rich membrane protein [Longicatena sp.]
MNIADIVVIGILILILGLIFYVTRGSKNKSSHCGGCHSDCSSCSSFSSFYEDYKKEQHLKNEKE